MPAFVSPSYCRDTPPPNEIDAKPKPALARLLSQCRTGSKRVYLARQPDILETLLPAFGVMAQGSLITTPAGPVAIEDLQLGDEIQSPSGDAARIEWIGEAMVNSGATEYPWLRRVQADRFGFTRPTVDTVLGRGAVLVAGPDAAQARQLGEYGVDELIAEVSPPAPVRLFHISCDRPSNILVNGLSLRSLDPSSFMQDKPESFRETFRAMMPNGSLPAAEPKPWIASTPNGRGITA